VGLGQALVQLTKSASHNTISFAMGLISYLKDIQAARKSASSQRKRSQLVIQLEGKIESQREEIAALRLELRIAEEKLIVADVSINQLSTVCARDRQRVLYETQQFRANGHEQGEIHE
jgi:cell shape-determining protein MreC